MPIVHTRLLLGPARLDVVLLCSRNESFRDSGCNSICPVRSPSNARCCKAPARSAMNLPQFHIYRRANNFPAWPRIRLADHGVHGRPKIIQAQPQHQFENTFVSLGPDVSKLRIESLRCPLVYAPVLIVDENAAVFHRGRVRLRRGNFHRERVLMPHRHVRPPIPGRDANQLRKLHQTGTPCRADRCRQSPARRGPRLERVYRQSP